MTLCPLIMPSITSAQTQRTGGMDVNKSYHIMMPTTV